MTNLRALLLGLAVTGCWGSADAEDDTDPPPAPPGKVAERQQATECRSLDAVSACYSCDGALEPGALLELDGTKLWNPPPSSRWRLVDHDGERSTWCRE